MLEAVSLQSLLALPHRPWMWTYSHWTREQTVALQMLVRADVTPTLAADIIGRSPSSLAHRALDTGLKVPRQWRDTVRRRALGAEPRVKLQYPYIMEVRGEYADLLAVNAVVPRGLPEHMRADVCQEIMLALWQKQTTLEELSADKSVVRKFISGFRKANLEGGGYALSLDLPMRDGRSWYDVLPDESHAP